MEQSTVINSVDRSRGNLRMTVGFGNVEVIGDFKKITFTGEVKQTVLLKCIQEKM